MAKAPNNNDTQVVEEDLESKFPICGIIMPIANTPSYKDGHWTEVYSLLCESAVLAGLKPNLVSFDDDVTVLHKRIIRNIYFNPIVVCDISSRNPNVMFELGMRLAFDKPTIIVKDDITVNAFDISSIEYLEYPSDLRYQAVINFKEKLAKKMIETLKRASDDNEYSTFLKNFGDFKTARVEEKEVSMNELIMDELRDIRRLVNNQVKGNNIKTEKEIISGANHSIYNFNITPTPENMDKVLDILKHSPFKISEMSSFDESTMRIRFQDTISSSDAMQLNSFLVAEIKSN